jgi:hypothetical protein
VCNFNSIRVKYALIYVKKALLLKSKMVNFKLVILKN